MEKYEGQLMWEYIVSVINKEVDYKVFFDPSNNIVTCNCRKFDSVEILCFHALIVYERNDVNIMLDRYIIHWWKKITKIGVIYNLRREEI